MIDAIVEPLILPRMNRTKLEELDTEQRLVALEEHLRMIEKIVSEILRRVISITNWQLLISNVGAYYFQLPNSSTGNYAAGDLRFRRTAAYTLALEVHDGTSWLTDDADVLAKWKYSD